RQVNGRTEALGRLHLLIKHPLRRKVQAVRDFVRELVGEHAKLDQMLILVYPGNVSPPKGRARGFDRSGEAVTLPPLCDRVEEARRIEIGDQDALHQIAEFPRLARVAYFQQIAHPGRRDSQVNGLVEEVAWMKES